MGVTPNASIPYPEDADVVRQGAQNMKAMALALDPRWSGGSLVRRIDMNVATATGTPIAWSGAVNTPNVGGSVPVAASGITVGQAGIYLVHAVAHWNSNATGNRTLQLLQNGAVIVDDNSDTRPSAGASIRTVNDVTRAVRCAAGDVINATVNQTSGVTLTMIWARLHVYRIA